MEVVGVYMKGPAIGVADMLWKNIAPSKVQFCGLLAWKGRLKTSTFLKRIGVLNIEASSLCLLCKAEEKTVNHVLLFCPLVWKVWTDILKWWDLVWVLPGQLRNECLFHGKTVEGLELSELVKVRVALWSKHSTRDLQYSVEDIVNNLDKIKAY
ncbi:hypothetical protein ACSBR2_035481 [Camellia fascicularis]